MITWTHNGYHLGDNLVHLNFLRKVALSNPDRKFVHSAQWQYIRQLRDVISDVPNIELVEFGYMTPSDSINAWRGDKQFWYSHPDRNDFVKFHVEAWFPYLADMMNVENPIKSPLDMLFDYPAIQKYGVIGCDVLIINSPPASGQFRDYNENQLDGIRTRMVEKGLQVVTSWPSNARTATQFGSLSLHCHTILMVSTGPSWPTFNIWNQESVKLRIVLLDSEQINLDSHTVHCRTIHTAESCLKMAGLL